jgi:hypothetical protein
MDKINGLFESEVLKVVEAFPSIYTKDDVVSLLTTLRTQVLTEVSDALSEANKASAGITEAQILEFSADVESQLSRALENGDIQVIDDSSAEFSINYDNRVELENININTDNIIDELNAILLEQFRDHFVQLLTDNDKPE